MKVECPKCRYEWNEELHATICPKKVALTQSIKMDNIFHQIDKKTERGLFAQQIFDIIERLGGEEISVKKIANLLNVYKYTDGDLIRTILDYHVCKGQLKKTRYKKGRGGHRWVFVSLKPVVCNDYSIDIMGNQLCLNKNWKKIEEGEEIID